MDTGAGILLIAGAKDEAWPSDYSVRYIERQLKEAKCDRDDKVCLYPYGSYLIGVMPNRDREKGLYAALVLAVSVSISFFFSKRIRNLDMVDVLKGVE